MWTQISYISDAHTEAWMHAKHVTHVARGRRIAKRQNCVVWSWERVGLDLCSHFDRKRTLMVTSRVARNETLRSERIRLDRPTTNVPPGCGWVYLSSSFQDTTLRNRKSITWTVSCLLSVSTVLMYFVLYCSLYVYSFLVCIGVRSTGIGWTPNCSKIIIIIIKLNSVAFNPQANYTDRASEVSANFCG
jgi:hypothetical protein